MLTIYDGGSDMDSHLNDFNGNTLPPSTWSTGNQIFITYTNNANGLGKGFSASFAFGKRVTKTNFRNFELLNM